MKIFFSSFLCGSIGSFRLLLFLLNYCWGLKNFKRNRFETLQEKTEKNSPNDEYENFVNAHLEAAAKYIPTKLKSKYRVPCETLAVREKRALVKTASTYYRKKTQQTQMPEN